MLVILLYYARCADWQLNTEITAPKGACSPKWFRTKKKSIYKKNKLPWARLSRGGSRVLTSLMHYVPQCDQWQSSKCLFSGSWCPRKKQRGTAPLRKRGDNNAPRWYTLRSLTACTKWSCSWEHAREKLSQRQTSGAHFLYALSSLCRVL